MTASVLVTGGAHGDIPVIEACRELGYRVVTSGNRPLDPGHALADGYEPADYSDADSIVRAARQHGVIGIIPSCHDMAAVAAAAAASRLGLPGHDQPMTALAIHDKARLRSELRDASVPTPLSRRCTTLTDAQAAAEAIGFPVILKPTGLAGGRGVAVAHQREDLTAAFAHARSVAVCGDLIVEQYLDGTHHGVTMLLASGEVAFSFADDEYYFLNPYRVAGTHSQTSLSRAEQNQIAGWTRQLSAHLGLVDGLLHLQVMRATTGLFVMEVCRRTPGDFYPKFVDIATSVNYTQGIVTGFLGQGVGPFSPVKAALPTIRHVAMPQTEGIFMGVSVRPDWLPYVRAEFDWREPGQVVDDHLTWAARVILLQPPAESLMDIVASIQQGVRVIVRRPRMDAARSPSLGA